MLAPTKLVVIREGVETEVEVEHWVAIGSVLSFRLPIAHHWRLSEALGGEREYDSVSFALRCEGVEYPGCRVYAWYRNGIVVVRSLPPS